jgi:hypothetical protein
MPSNVYINREPLFDEVFKSGIAPYRTNTTLDLELEEIKPYFANEYPYRGTYKGASGLFTADERDITSAEVLGTFGFQSAPSPSFLIHYEFSGDAVLLDQVQNPVFQEQFMQATGIAKHEFSQDCRYYLESHGSVSDVQSLAWKSAFWKCTWY